jgi:hypothetical protein
LRWDWRELALSLRYVLAKSLQVVGLFVLPIALVIGMTEPDAMYRELGLLALGAALFILGRTLEPKDD